MKKKLTFFATLALCATVGSVYATWTYAQDTATSLDETVSAAITTADTIAKGDIELVSNGLTMVVSNDGTYKTKLTMGGELKVKFTPAENTTAPDTIKIQYTLSTSDGWIYEGKDIFTVDASPVSLGEAASAWSLSGVDLQNYIEMTAFTLDTLEEHSAFETALQAGELMITFSEVTA